MGSARLVSGIVVFVLAACGPSVASDEEERFRESVVGFYSTALSPNQPAPAGTSERTVLELTDDGRWASYVHRCDGRISDEKELDWSVESASERQIRLEFVRGDGDVSFVVWRFPDPCSIDSFVDAVDAFGNSSRSFEPGRYSNPTLSDHNELDDTYECAFEFVGDVPPICAGEPE